jgi:general secretion pathway protein J
MNKSAECGMLNAEWQKGEKREATNSELPPTHLKGFTLLEVLLAMAILAVIMTVVYMSFSTASNNVQQAETIRDEADLARALVTRLSSDIANAYVSPAMSSITFFSGKKEEVLGESENVRHDRIMMTTLTNWPKTSKETELWEVGYFFKEKPDGKGYTLFRRQKPELSKDVPPGEGGFEYELTDRVQSLQIRYSAEGTTWRDEWTGGSLPKVVEIILTMDNKKVYTTKVDVGNS